MSQTFQEKLLETIYLFDNWIPKPEDSIQIEQWVESAKEIIHMFEYTEEEEQYMNRIIEMYCLDASSTNEITNEITNDPSDKNALDELLRRKQTEQRTPEWYAQMSTIVSASEISNLFSTPYQRAKFVISKTIPPAHRNQSLAVMSERMSAFDWGIRFEPVVKQIYEFKYAATIKELGRLHHPLDPKCTASPDGLIYDSARPEKIGRLIEIKCPVTREIDGKVPKEYYAQMQLQLNVTGRSQCEYVEASFSSIYNTMPQKQGPPQYYGLIALIRKEGALFNQEFSYEYGPVNNDEWRPDTKEMDKEIVEIIPWRLLEWSEQVIVRNEEWWTTLQPLMELFWEDVEKAKRGEFVMPESARPAKKAKVESCKIMFTVTKME
jgi:hypothetical protein